MSRGIPQGIEVLVSKASIDPEFKALLLERRAGAAELIGLALDPSEAVMLAAVPTDQLEAIIARTSVPPEHRRAFLGQAAAVMLAALGIAAPGCKPGPGPVGGSRPDHPPESEKPAPSGSPKSQSDSPKK